MNDATTQHRHHPLDQHPLAALVMRGTFGGILMGLANLVPGISGGTMLLAAGVYEPFVNAIAEITTGKFRFRSLVLLASVVGAAGLGIVLLAGVLKELVVEQRWVMYSLFIGLTLGGLPIVLRMVRPITRGAVVASVVAFALMALLAVLQALGIVGSLPSTIFILFAGGVAGASAMILPGLSGGYLLLLMGQYVPILSAIDQFKEALRAGDLSSALQPAFSVMLPVGLGVLIGVVAVSNVLHWFLHHHRKATLGVLIGLLLGSVVGLWPFQTYLKPTVGETVIKGRLVTDDNFAEFDREDWPTQWFRPSLGQVVASLAIIGVGLGITLGVAALGGSEDASPEESPES